MRALGCQAGALAVMLLGAAPATATTLAEALAATYVNNPQLAGQRAALRATDEQYGIIRAQGLPQINANAQVQQGVRNYAAFNGFGRVTQGGGQLSVPVWQGGRIKTALRGADARVQSGQQSLRAVEGDVFVSAATAYMDVLRDRAIVDLNVNNVKVLDTNLQATSDRFQAGDLTRTDVAQSKARLEGARSQLAAARATLTASEENFRAVVGQAAGALELPPSMPLLPADADRAEATALDENPDIAAAADQVKAFHADVDAARANRNPTISASAGENYYRYENPSGGGGINGVGSGTFKGDYATVGATLTLPLYQGGLVGAQVRQAQAFEAQALEQRVQTERQVVATVRASFANFRALTATEASSAEQVKANTLALEGLRAEQSVGLRQVLDVLNGEQELLSSKVTLVSAQHDAYIAGFQLLNAMGLVNYRRLGLTGGSLYDPQIHYERTRHAISDFAYDPTPVATTKPTYGPAVPAEIPPVTPLAK